MKKFRLLFGVILIYLITVSAQAATLVPGGQLIGMQLQEGSVTVAAFHPELGTAAKKAGLQEGDRILRINNTPVSSAEDVRTALAGIKGSVQLHILRNNKAKRLTVTPQTTENGPILGVFLRQGISGVGTLTYYDPETGDFAALGHGVNSKNGNLLPLLRGNIYDAQVQGVRKGTPGKPGQLMGEVTSPETTGDLQKNTPQGVFGKLHTPAENADPLPVADPKEVKTGPAIIRSTTQGNTLREYSVEILKIYPNSGERTRNMLIKITDPALLNTTGGIVQGMSGSPIIQNGKLVGAVTHVLVNDPTTGYGIFIENMLDAAA